MGFKFASFGAATVPLSKIVVDKDLDMGPYAIKGVYRPEEWATETLEWGDIPPGEPIPIEGSITGKDTWITLFTFDVPTGNSYKWRFTFIIQAGSSNTKGTFKITANGNEIFYATDVPGNMSGTPWTFDVIIPAGSTVTIEGSKNTELLYKVLSGSNVQNLGLVGGPKTFNLAGRWLALGIDMHGLDATIKIYGVEVPYSDYAKYFPLVPRELKIPGNWSPTQKRPEIRVYKGVYRPEELPTETLDWGDIPPGEPIPFIANITGKDTWNTLFTFDVPTGDTYKWRFTFIIGAGSSDTKGTFKITANGEEIFYVSDIPYGTWTFDVIIPAGSTATIQASKNTELYYHIKSGSSVQNLGFVCGPKTFDLTGKWLALGIDMHGLDATIKIHGVEVPYSDYAKYFPIAPTELKIPGNWSPTQKRPEIRVYK